MDLNADINSYLAFAVLGISCGATMAWLALKRKTLVYPRHLFLKQDTLLTKEPSATEGKEVKLVVIVRKDLKMTKGKGISQCCHAAVRATNRAKNYPELYQKYMQNGRPTAVLKVEDLYEMKSIAANACKLGLLVSPINDAGRTQVAPGELTVVGLGPGPSELLDKVTEGLPEY